MSRCLFVLMVAGVISACGDNNNGPSSDYTEARRKLAQTYSIYAKSGYDELANKTQSLRTAISSFVEEPDTESLQLARESLNAARLVWQSVGPFQFGPAEDVLLRSSLNTYPSDPEKIESNIESSDYTLGSPANIGAEGFPAIEYLLFGEDLTDAEIVLNFLNDSTNHRSDYLTALSENIRSLSENVSDTWEDSYGDQFESDGALGTDVGSSLSLIVNSYEFYMQRFLRDGKVGIPAGVRSAGVPRPTATEAYYSGKSVKYLVRALREIQMIYTGDAVPTGYGLQNYLVELNFEDLSSEINLQLTETIEKAQTLQDPLSSQITEDNDAVLDVFLEIQKLVPMIKSDMASAMGVIITNQDADGD